MTSTEQRETEQRKKHEDQLVRVEKQQEKDQKEEHIEKEGLDKTKGKGKGMQDTTNMLLLKDMVGKKTWKRQAMEKGIIKIGNANNEPGNGKRKAQQESNMGLDEIQLITKRICEQKDTQTAAAAKQPFRKRKMDEMARLRYSSGL
ncbi:hypothetical protein PIB30_068437 [Stylosanthes scabra]|uniref:Uncharacterized protein n=1 Tax=Stylosanthes scabra TaxID=79078 RepID=A0ABU6YKG7_9FABA|nr:hypothetical protein [Stylosanthes scabra]